MLHGAGPEPHDHAPEHTLDEAIDAHLAIFIDGTQVAIPANIGVGATDFVSPVHTIDTTGRLLLEPLTGQPLTEYLTLGDVFDTWRTNAGLAGNNPDAILSSTQLMTSMADSGHMVRMYVNGIQTSQFENYVIHDDDEILLSFLPTVEPDPDNPLVTFNTNFGPIPIELFPKDAPGTVNNFFNYLNDDDYINSFFHRSISDFVVQGGGFTTTDPVFSSLSQISTISKDGPILNEFGLSNVRNTVAMAKLGGDPNSATDEFFFNVRDNSANLDAQNGGFTVFGRVTDMTVVDYINSLNTVSLGTATFTDVPVADGARLAVIESIDVENPPSTNSSPTLRPIDTIVTTIGSTVTVPIEAVDPEGDAVQFIFEIDDASAIQFAGPDSLSLPANQVATTNLTISPVDGFIGTTTITVIVAPGNIAPDDPDFEDVADRRTVQVNVTPLPPATLSLISDTGTSDTDRITSTNNAPGNRMIFRTTGLLLGATVTLFDGQTVIGQGTVTDESLLVIETNEAFTLIDGLHTITARQTFNEVQSKLPRSLGVTVDTTAAVFTTLPVLLAHTDTPYSYNANTNEEMTPGVTYRLLTAPTGMTIDPATGVVSWTPTVDQAGTQSVTIEVEDRAGHTSQQAFDLFVRKPEPPVLDAIADRMIDEQTLLALFATASDNNLPRDVLTFSLDPGAPTGAMINPSTGEFRWTPDEVHGPGVFEVTVRVSDTDGFSDTQTLRITVKEVNRAPEIDSVDFPLVFAGDTLRTFIPATDPDIPAGTLTFSLEPDAPEGAIIDPVTGELVWTTPDDVTFATFAFTVRVTDDGSPSLSSTRTFEVTVGSAVLALFRSDPLNALPQVAPIPVDATAFDIALSSLSNPTTGVTSVLPPLGGTSADNPLSETGVQAIHPPKQGPDEDSDSQDDQRPGDGAPDQGVQGTSEQPVQASTESPHEELPEVLTHVVPRDVSETFDSVEFHRMLIEIEGRVGDGDAVPKAPVNSASNAKPDDANAETASRENRSTSQPEAESSAFNDVPERHRTLRHTADAAVVSLAALSIAEKPSRETRRRRQWGQWQRRY